MLRPLNLIPSLVIVTGIVCLAVGAIAIASLDPSNRQADLFFVGLILASIGVGLRLHQR